MKDASRAWGAKREGQTGVGGGKRRGEGPVYGRPPRLLLRLCLQGERALDLPHLRVGRVLCAGCCVADVW